MQDSQESQYLVNEVVLISEPHLHPEKGLAVIKFKLQYIYSP